MAKILDTLKAVLKKIWAIGGGILAAVVVVIVAIVVILGMAPKDKQVVYLKDGELYLSMLDGKAPIELTSKFASGDVDKDSTAVLLARHYVKFSKDGKKVFYPDKWNNDSYSFDLYYRNTSGNAEAERIAKMLQVILLQRMEKPYIISVMKLYILIIQKKKQKLKTI